MFGFIISLGVFGYIAGRCLLNNVNDTAKAETSKKDGSVVYYDSKGKTRLSKDSKPVHIGLYEGHSSYLYDDGSVAYDFTEQNKKQTIKTLKEKAIENNDYFYHASDIKGSSFAVYLRRTSDDALFVREYIMRNNRPSLQPVAWPAKEIKDNDCTCYKADKDSSWYVEMTEPNVWEVKPATDKYSPFRFLTM